MMASTLPDPRSNPMSQHDAFRRTAARAKLMFFLSVTALAATALGLCAISRAQAAPAAADSNPATSPSTSPSSSAEPLFREAQQLVHDKKADDAIKVLRKAIEVDPNYLQARYGLAELLATKGDMSGAIAAVRDIIKLR